MSTTTKSEKLVSHTLCLVLDLVNQISEKWDYTGEAYDSSFEDQITTPKHHLWSLHHKMYQGQLEILYYTQSYSPLYLTLSQGLGKANGAWESADAMGVIRGMLYLRE